MRTMPRRTADDVVKPRKDPTECRKCMRKEPDIVIVAHRMCRECKNKYAVELRARHKAKRW